MSNEHAEQLPEGPLPWGPDSGPLNEADGVFDGVVIHHGNPTVFIDLARGSCTDKAEVSLQEDGDIFLSVNNPDGVANFTRAEAFELKRAIEKLLFIPPEEHPARMAKRKAPIPMKVRP